MTMGDHDGMDFNTHEKWCEFKARAEAAEREVLLLKGELVSSKSREWPDGFKALEEGRDAWKRCSEDLVNQRDELGEQLRVTRQCEKDRRNERDAAREALRAAKAERDMLLTATLGPPHHLACWRAGKHVRPCSLSYGPLPLPKKALAARMGGG